MLLLARFGSFIAVVPGIGMGDRGLLIRGPAVLVLAMTALSTSPVAAMPSDYAQMAAALFSELLLGLAIGLIPAMIAAGVDTAGHISSMSMGLGAAQLIDPTSGSQSNGVSQIMTGLTGVLFLLMGGHHVAIYAVSGFGARIIPGTFIPGEPTLELLIQRCAEVFRIGIMVSAPVLVALLLTQFVMGLVSKAVPTVNIFIVSFPLTIGIGLILVMLSLPELVRFVGIEFTGMESQMSVLAGDTTLAPNVSQPFDGSPTSPYP